MGDFIGTPGNDTIAGAGGGDRIDGGEGDDYLIGGYDFQGDGADTLLGGAGDDAIMGGPGGDSMDGGAGIDGLTYIDAEKGVLVNLRTGEARFGEAKGDVFFNFENVGGSRGDDTLTGDGADNVISGWTGDDLLLGAGGDDTLSGEQDADTLDGGGGDDVLIGGDARDTLIGSDGDDMLEGGAGADRLEGGRGSDTADFSIEGRVIIDLGAASPSGVVTGAGAGAKGDRLIGIENVIGSQNDDQLTGDGRANVLDGGFGGDDTLRGGGGDDTLLGGGETRFIGGAGADDIFGSGAADRFVYLETSDSSSRNGVDIVRQFIRQEGDRFDLSRIDADETARGDQAFDYIRDDRFSGEAGELRFVENETGGGFLTADVDGDRSADFRIKIGQVFDGTDSGDNMLRASDFIL